MTPTGFLVVAPSTLMVNEEFSLGLKVLCPPYAVGAACFRPSPGVVGRYNLSPRGIAYMDNTPTAWAGKVVLQGDAGYQGPGEYDFGGHAGPYEGDTRPIVRLAGLRFVTPGVKRITVVDPVSGVQTVSNPIEVTAEAPAERLYWADLHSQTFLSDGLRCPEELYAFARQEAFLDVFALADHTEMITPRQWEYMVGVTNDHNAPGEFVTLVGLEWTHPRLGHRNLHFPGDRAPFIHCRHPDYSDLEQLYRVARQEGGLVVPHHSANAAMGVDWALGHDPEVERLVEIYSVWGSSERPASAGNHRPIQVLGGEQPGQHVMDALARGYRFGFMGGGDIHDGRPGDELHNLQREPADYAHLWRQGVTGIWAKALTREAIFEALWNRRVVATTNVRTIVRFSVCGEPTGGQVRANGPRSLALEVRGALPLERVDIVRSGEDFVTLTPRGYDCDYQGEDVSATGDAWYYARVVHRGGETAWTSPVWVTSA